MRKFVFAIILLSLFLGLGFTKTEVVEAASGMVEIEQLARSQGINTNNLFVDPPITCYAPKAERRYQNDRISYTNGVFLLVTQMGNRGKLFVSSNTKCSQEHWDMRKYKPGIWQGYNYYNHQPNMYIGGLWNSLLRKGDRSKTPFCRANRVEIAIKRDWSSWFTEEGITYTKVVLYVPTESWFGLTREFAAASWWYISKDVTCFKTRREAERGGYRFLNK